MLAQRLLFREPSDVFDIEPDTRTYVAVTADSRMNPNDALGSPSDLFVIDADAAPDIDDSGVLSVVADPRIKMDELGRFELIEEPPGSYRLYSLFSPEIEVVRCPSSPT